MNYFDNCEITYFDVAVKDRILRVRHMVSKTKELCEKPYTLFTVRGEDAFDYPHGQAARRMIENGHHVISFDMPNHLSRINEFGEDIAGLRNAFVNGCDPFEAFVEDGRAVIDTCLEKGISTSGRILLESASRGGYFMLRLAAADERVKATAAFATVTDWKYLSEFSADYESEELKKTSILNYVEALTGKNLFITIGFCDDRVNTASCCQFAADLLNANLRAGCGYRTATFFCTPDEGHACTTEWYRRGAQWLLDQCV